MCVPCVSTFVSARIKTAYVGVNVRVNVFVSVLSFASLALHSLLSSGEDTVPKALLLSKAHEDRLAALYPDIL